MGISIIGIGESSKVAIFIFLFHLISLVLLSFFCGLFLYLNGTDVLTANFSLPPKTGSITTALFFGFAAAMLGISGFESSANFVEEQKKGVFPKTLTKYVDCCYSIQPAYGFSGISNNSDECGRTKSGSSFIIYGSDIRRIVAFCAYFNRCNPCIKRCSSYLIYWSQRTGRKNYSG